MPNNPTTVASPTGPSFSPFASNLSNLQDASQAIRNQTLLSLMKQLRGPSFSNVFEATPMDTLAQNYRQAALARTEGLASKGLGTSGAATASRRGLESEYSQGVEGIVAGANQQENQRIATLLGQMQNLGSADQQFLASMGQAALAQQGASSAEQLNNLLRDLMLAKGSATVASIAAGGIAGAAGAGASVGGAGGAGASAGFGGGTFGGGALAGLTLSNSLWGQGGYNPNTPQAGGAMQTPTPAYNGQPLTYSPYVSTQPAPSFMDILSRGLALGGS